MSAGNTNRLRYVCSGSNFRTLEYVDKAPEVMQLSNVPEDNASESNASEGISPEGNAFEGI